ncbi:MAG: hypothetical protein Q8L66_04005 [Caulobacter sp.]|nr:hypothetical protein [Caulobacter sp.]
MIAVLTIAVALLVEPDLPGASDTCRPAHIAFTPIAVDGRLVLPPTELIRIETFANSAGIGDVSIDAKEQGPSSNDAVLLVSDALMKTVVGRVSLTLMSGPRGGYVFRDTPPSLEVSVTVECGA